MVGPLHILCSTRRIAWPVLGCLRTETSPVESQIPVLPPGLLAPQSSHGPQGWSRWKAEPIGPTKTECPSEPTISNSSLFRYHSAEVLGSFDRTAIEPNPVIMDANSATLQLSPAPEISLSIRLTYVPLKSYGPLLPEGCSPSYPPLLFLVPMAVLLLALQPKLTENPQAHASP